MRPEQFKQHRKDLTPTKAELEARRGRQKIKGISQQELANRLGLSSKNGNGARNIRSIEGGTHEASGVLLTCFEFVIEYDNMLLPKKRR